MLVSQANAPNANFRASKIGSKIGSIKCFVLLSLEPRSDEMLSAFLELERITHELVRSALLGDN
jgi:hypothetical protein